MRPVELIDDDEDDEGPGSVGPSSRDDRAAAAGGPRHPGTTDGTWPPRGWRWWPWVVGALVVAVGAGALATAATERAARERADTFARFPGVVRPLEAAPAVRWRAPADGPTPVIAAGGALVTVSGSQGMWTVRSLDAATGDERWQVPVVEQSGSGFESVVVRCSGGDEAPAVLLCVWTAPNVVYGGAGESTPYVPPTHVLALDPVDGTQRGAWELPGTPLGVVRHGDDLVVASALSDRRVLVERHDGTDGTVRWSWTSPGVLVDTGGLRAAPVLVGGGDVVALVAVSTAVLDARRGRVLEEGPPGRQILLRALPDGGYATWASALGGHLRDPGWEVRATVPALPSSVVGDRSVDTLLLDAGNRVLAVSPADGATAWMLPTSMTPVAVADGVVVLAGDASVGAVDGTDGRLLWQQDLRDELLSAPLTDGLQVLVAEPDGTAGADGAGGHVLVARGLRDGVETWRVALPADVRSVVAVGGHVVARTATEVVVLG